MGNTTTTASSPNHRRPYWSGIQPLYEDAAVLTNAPQGSTPDQKRSAKSLPLSTGASITMNESVALEAGDLALVHWSWTMKFPDGRQAEGATGEVLRRQP